jgi:hypothetical protein
MLVNGMHINGTLINDILINKIYRDGMPEHLIHCVCSCEAQTRLFAPSGIAVG